MEISLWVAVILQSPIWSCKGHPHDYDCKISNQLNALEGPRGLFIINERRSSYYVKGILGSLKAVCVRVLSDTNKSCYSPLG